jgi:hypothetical protein
MSSAILCLLVAIAAKPVAAGNPRLFVHQHTPYADMGRVDRELSLAVELGFGGVRTEWGPKELLNADNRGVSDWAKEKVILPYLRRVKEKGLRLHITFGAHRERATVSQEMALFRYVMTTSAEMFSADQLSWSIANEPKAWEDRKPDRYLVDRAKAMIDFWDDSKLHARGYWLFTPTLHGWQHWDSAPVLMSEEIHKGLDYVQWVYGQPDYRSFLRRLAVAFHCYAPASGYDAGQYAREKAVASSRLIGTKLVSHPQAITEFNVRYTLGVSMYQHGLKCGEMAKELLKISAFRFVTVYCLAAHKEMEFISDRGDRNEDRIRGFKEGL